MDYVLIYYLSVPLMLVYGWVCIRTFWKFMIKGQRDVRPEVQGRMCLAASLAVLFMIADKLGDERAVPHIIMWFVFFFMNLFELWILNSWFDNESQN